MRTIPLFLALTLALSLTACTSPGARKTPAPADTPSPAPEVSPAPAELRWTDQTFAQEFTSQDGTVVMSVSYVFPGIADAGTDPAWSKIHDFYATEGAAYLTNAAELAGWAADDYTVSAATGGDFLPYGEESGWRISHQTEDLVSFVRSYYANSVTGAAHPSNYQFSEQFDLTTGDRLSLNDFFTDPETAKERILTLLAEKAADAGYTRDMLEGEFKEDYFYLTDNAFVFYYQPDTLAPYAAGLLEFSIPYPDLEDLMSRAV